MMMNLYEKFDAVHRLVKVATGSRWGDEEVVSGIGIGYAEPGYYDGETMWVLGNWNPVRFPSKDDPPLTKEENVGPRLAKALERLGVECEWLDEWEICVHCQKIVRVSPDSYAWKPFYHRFNDGDLLCGNCILDDDFIQDAIDEFVNNSDRCLAFCDDDKLEELGWRRYNSEKYENGLHPGQEDDPKKIAEQIKQELPDHDYLFLLDNSSQFYIQFSAFVRPSQ